MLKKLCLSFLFLIAAAFNLFADLNSVRNLYTIQGDRLVSADGEVYSKIPFKDDLHENLSYKLKDPEWADLIYLAYENTFQVVLKSSEKEPFKRAILNVCQLFGTEISLSDHALEKALLDEGVPIQEWRKIHSKRWQRFLDMLHSDNHSRSPEKAIGSPMRIVVITTTTSGGNLSVADALKAHLDRFPRMFETTVIDYETFASKHDPILIATGKFTTDNIFRMLQQENIVDEMLIDKDLMCQEVAKYIPNRTAKAMKDAIRKIAPDLIISTRNYYADDFNLLTLNTPFRMLNCDHDICFFHQGLVGKVDPTRIKFWLPSSSPRFFKTLFEMRGHPEFYNKDDSWNELTEKIALLTHSTPAEIREQFEVIGFPVRLEFHQIRHEFMLEAFRKKWDLERDEKGVLVEMGANGVGILNDIFHQLKTSSSHSTPIKYYFVCGRNEALKNELQKNLAAENFENSALKRCAVLGFLSALKKNELMNICSLMVGKPGGSTMAEVSKLELPMFVMHIQKVCERGNLEKLVDDHLAYPYQPELPLSTQIEKTLQSAADQKRDLQDPHWEMLILRKLLMLKSTLSNAKS